MAFPISGEHIDPFYLMAIGFIVGILGGFFGVGGSFLAGPALFAFGVPMNFVVGTDLAHIVGKSIVAAKRHSLLGNVDIKLGLMMVFGTIFGVEAGAQGIEWLKRHANVDLVVGIAFIVVLLSITGFTAWESVETWRRRRRRSKRESQKDTKRDESAFDHISKSVHRFKLWPMISLPQSGVKEVS